MPQLKVSCGASRESLQVVPVNYDVSSPVEVSSDLFEGQISVRIRDFAGDAGKGKERLTTTESSYFDDYPRLTWSMAIQGRFKQEVNADDILYGNIFDKPIRDSLPYGTAAALKFVNYVDPALQQDIYADKPWALSPTLSTMNHLNISKIDAVPGKVPDWDPLQPEEDVSVLDPGKLRQLKGNPDGRKAFFAKAENRTGVVLTPDHWVKMDFCNGYMDFNSLSLKLPGGLHFSLMRYWDGQPVTYVCRSRDGEKAYFYIVFEIIDETDKLQSKGSQDKQSEPLGQNMKGSQEDNNLDID